MLFGVACTSQAQSSVTLYGIIDTGLVYVTNSSGHTAYQQASGKLSGDRWGLLGAEDLGNGMKAIFDLENGFDLSSGKLGQNSRMFGRQAFVGLSDNRLGTLTLGRQYDSVVDYLALIPATGTFEAHPYDNDNIHNSIRINNAVKFQSIDYGGFRFGGLYGFSNAAGSFADSRAYSVGASYKFGGLTLASAYLQLNNPGSSTNPNGAVATGDSTFYAGRQRTWGAGVNYTIGAAAVALLVTQTQLNNATAIGSSAAGTFGNLHLTGGSAQFTNYEVSGTYRFTPSWSLNGAYTFTDARLDGVSPKYHQIAVLSDYAFSKRTDVYATAAFQHVSSAGNSGITADIYSIGRSSTTSQFVTMLGIRHRF